MEFVAAKAGCPGDSSENIEVVRDQHLLLEFAEELVVAGAERDFLQQIVYDRTRASGVRRRLSPLAGAEAADWAFAATYATVASLYADRMTVAAVEPRTAVHWIEHFFCLPQTKYFPRRNLFNILNSEDTLTRTPECLLSRTIFSPIEIAKMASPT